jgi:hypothetical protein
VSLIRVSARFLIGVGAWLLGAGAATGGSLLAVSVLGQGLAPAPGQQLTVAAVNRALASEAAEASRSPAPPMPPVSSSATPLAPRPKKTSPAPSASPRAPDPQPTTAVLTSVGGSVVAGCQPAGAYLVSWSPAQGYQETQVVRGPAAKAKVAFAGSRKLVTMVISCTDGAPSAATTVSNWGDE